MRKNYWVVILACVCMAGTAVLFTTFLPLTAQTGRAALFQAMRADRQPAHTAEVMQQTTCTNGMAGEYPCQNVTLLAHMPLNKIGGGEGNDIWGWTDPENGREYALMGRTSGTAFVDITDPANPTYLGDLSTHTVDSLWRDVKVYANYAFIVSEAPNHGVQIFDLTQLRNVANPPVNFQSTTHYDQVGSAHNIAINTNSGYAYVVGSNSCAGGLHMINIQDPLNPAFAGCFATDGYTHDAQCINYNGPDSAYQGHEICFNANEDTLTIVDVTDKNNPVQLARKSYAGVSYTHQGWITDDHAYFLLGDESDEISSGHNTRTYIWDVSNLNFPFTLRRYTGPTPSIDHNLYIDNTRVYQANYRSGLRVLDITEIADSQPDEIAYFDTFPTNDTPNFNGAWSVYPYFDSGAIIVSDIERGLFVLKLDFTPPAETHESFTPFVTMP